MSPPHPSSAKTTDNIYPGQALYGYESANASKDVDYSLISYGGLHTDGLRGASLSVHYPFSPHISACPLSPQTSTCLSSPYSVLSSPYSSVSSPRPCGVRPSDALCASDFRPVRVLGSGGHGTVYLVEDVVTERRLAMKVIEKNGLRLREYPAVFEEQAVARGLATATGDAAWFAPLRASFEDSDNFYLLMDYYPRGDLKRVMKRTGKIEEDQARRWCVELLAALEQLHKRRIVHRDVKPDNILLDDTGHLVLTDFGIARAFKRQDADRPWKRTDVTHSLVGTPGYTAPEVYSGKYSYEADVWGAGVVLYQMLVGKLPFGLDPKGQRLEEMIARTDSIPADFDLYGVVDVTVRDLLTKMLDKDPRKRPTIRKLKKHRWFREM
ncbi:kinase-like domain-containing protein [Trametes elegans]|nr:kinase-like domain-containing protein [Trametes elegans]